MSERERSVMMAAYCFFDVHEITAPEKMDRYREGVLSTVEQYGGRYLTVGGKFDVVEGDWQPVFPVIIEFPSLEQAHRWYDSEEYRDLKALRLEATRGNAVFIEGTGFGK
jgi:uncharacterized protein (DUF1330 family)